MVSGPHHENLIISIKALSPNIVPLEVRTSTREFDWDTIPSKTLLDPSSQSPEKTTLSHFQTLVMMVCTEIVMYLHTYFWNYRYRHYIFWLHIMMTRKLVDLTLSPNSQLKKFLPVLTLTFSTG